MPLSIPRGASFPETDFNTTLTAGDLVLNIPMRATQYGNVVFLRVMSQQVGQSTIFPPSVALLLPVAFRPSGIRRDLIAPPIRSEIRLGTGTYDPGVDATSLTFRIFAVTGSLFVNPVGADFNSFVDIGLPWGWSVSYDL